MLARLSWSGEGRKSYLGHHLHPGFGCIISAAVIGTPPAALVISSVRAALTAANVQPMILRAAEAIAVGLSFAKAVGWGARLRLEESVPEVLAGPVKPGKQRGCGDAHHSQFSNDVIPLTQRQVNCLQVLRLFGCLLAANIRFYIVNSREAGERLLRH